MKIPDEILIELVKHVAGNDTIKLFDVLNNKKNVSEFKIAEKLGISVNQVRNMIYRMQEHNLVQFTRKKDKVKGWYIYYWTFDKPKAVVLIVDLKSKSIEKIKKELKNIDNTRLYLCDSCRTKVSEEEAMESQFFCETCGEILKLQDSEKRAKELTKKLKKDEEYLKIASDALKEYREKLAKETDKAIEKEKEVKDKERARAKEENKMLDESKKKSKKTPKKKAPIKKKPSKKTKKNVSRKKTSKKIVKITSKKTPNNVVVKPKKKGILKRVFKR